MSATEILIMENMKMKKTINKNAKCNPPSTFLVSDNILSSTNYAQLL